MPRKSSKKGNVQRKAKPNKRKSSRAKGKSGSSGPQPNRSMLDRGGVAYAQLLRDPCNSALTGFYGGPSGYVQRFTSTFNVGTTAGSTAGILAVLPGYSYSLGYQDVAAESTGVTSFGYASTNMPGNNFIANTAKESRVLACCVKLFSNASENTRSGFVFYGNVGAGECPAQGGSGTTPAQVETLCPISVRTPTDCVEIRWMPGENDTNYLSQPGTALPMQGDAQGLLIGWSGQPAAVGFKVVITTVVEWLPNITNGFTVNAMQPPASMSTLSQIKAALYRADPNWWHRAGQIMFRAVRGAAMGSGYGAMGSVVGAMRALTM